ncbi:MAG: hypothetical protein RMJ81_07360 [Candidatus Kryptonium sp.]|nr:hypothetical protein [Candidatus Kryptonium sp.]MCX7762880.1 hypothetical protein [Candidatus Kryptonium sp.]MDW8109452.1 hypothetical protein [Candidatus Kryptonium sp.]
MKKEVKIVLAGLTALGVGLAVGYMIANWLINDLMKEISVDLDEEEVASELHQQVEEES